MTATRPSPASSSRLPTRKLASILPLLMLCVSSCATGSHPSLSIQPVPGNPTGNAYRLLLPTGTRIAFPDAASYRQVTTVAANEIDLSALNSQLSTRELQLTSPVQLVSAAYIAQRNTVELQLLRTITELKEENARLRASR